jgi:hypothetical protein
MTKRKYVTLCVLLIALTVVIYLRTPEPVVLTNVTTATLQQAAGSFVTVTGTYYLEKEGDVVDASGIAIPFDLTPSIDFPEDVNQIAATGRLVEITDRKDLTRFDYPFRLLNASWKRAPPSTP